MARPTPELDKLRNALDPAREIVAEVETKLGLDPDAVSDKLPEGESDREALAGRIEDWKAELATILNTQIGDVPVADAIGTYPEDHPDEYKVGKADYDDIKAAADRAQKALEAIAKAEEELAVADEPESPPASQGDGDGDTKGAEGAGSGDQDGAKPDTKDTPAARTPVAGLMTASLDISYSRKFEVDTSASSKIEVTIKPYPAPDRFVTAVRAAYARDTS